MVDPPDLSTWPLTDITRPVQGLQVRILDSPREVGDTISSLALKMRAACPEAGRNAKMARKIREMAEIRERYDGTRSGCVHRLGKPGEYQ